MTAPRIEEGHDGAVWIVHGDIRHRLHPAAAATVLRVYQGLRADGRGNADTFLHGCVEALEAAAPGERATIALRWIEIGKVTPP